MPRPDLYAWADDAAADVSEPSASRKALGYVGGMVPPAGQHNWLFQKFWEWFAWLSDSPVVYPTLQAAALDTEAGDICVVDEKSDQSAGTLDAGYASNGKAAGTDLIDIAVSATHVFYAELATTHRGALRSAPGTATLSLVQTNAGTVRRIVTDGAIVLICYGNYVEAYTATTGASLWAYNHGAAVNDACFGASGIVFICGALGTGNVHARTISRTLGTASANYRHSNAAGTLEACCYANDGYYIAGAVSDYASLASLRCLTTGLLAATAEGPGVADLAGRAWNVATVAPDTVTRNGALTTDGRLLYVGYATAAAVQAEARNLVTGAAAGTIDLGAHTVNSIDVDHRWLVVGTIDTGDANRAHVYGIDPQTMQLAWHYRYGTATTALNGVVIDGNRAWACLAIGAAENGVLKIITGRETSTYRRMEYTSLADVAYSNPSGLRGLLVPVE